VAPSCDVDANFSFHIERPELCQKVLPNGGWSPFSAFVMGAINPRSRAMNIEFV
jgi:hypothetical protein